MPVIRLADMSLTNRLEQVVEKGSQDLNLLSRTTLGIFRP